MFFADIVMTYFTTIQTDLICSFVKRTIATLRVARVLKWMVMWMIKDSGNRREFESGAVRDIQEGKGRCDLLPLDVVGDWLHHCLIGEEWIDDIFRQLELYQREGNSIYLEIVLSKAQNMFNEDLGTMLLEVSKHFEEGAKKYGEYNWQKGIPTHCYIDSAVRHYLKYLRGDTDEQHDRAFVWNILCCIWTCIHLPHLNDYRKDNSNDKD